MRASVVDFSSNPCFASLSIVVSQKFASDLARAALDLDEPTAVSFDEFGMVGDGFGDTRRADQRFGFHAVPEHVGRCSGK